jgi:predicted acetyltransferase
MPGACRRTDAATHSLLLRGPSGVDGVRHYEQMDVAVVEALDDDRTVVRRLLQLYHYDFSEFDGGDVNPHGEYLHRYLDEYWTDSDRKAFLLRVEGELAGFVLVFTGEPHDIAEFFVMRKYRGRGVGAQAAAFLFGRFPGRWTVRQQLANPAATAFWRRAIRYPFQEQEQGTEIVQSFTTGFDAVGLVLSRSSSIAARVERCG